MFLYKKLLCILKKGRNITHNNIIKKVNKSLAFTVIVLFIGVSFQPIIAEKTVSVEKESNYNNVDFEDAKEYLFQTLIAISSNPDVKELLKQNDHKVFTSDYNYKSAFSQIFLKKPRLLLSILFTKPKMTYEYLEKNYNKVLEIIDILGIEETSNIGESVKISNPELFNDLQNIILNDKELSNRISVLEEMNNNLNSNLGFQNNSIICNILNIIITPFLLGMMFSLFLLDWSMYRNNSLLCTISLWLFESFAIISVNIGLIMIAFNCPIWEL